MKIKLLTYYFLLMAGFASAQNMERKLIIQNGKYYFTTIHEEFQVATLYTGDVEKPMQEAKKLALPAGRNYSEPVNPFCWDIANGFVYAISFLVHPLNDRNEAIKKIDMRTLKEWNEQTKVTDLLMQSAEMNMWMYNDPYKYVTKKSKILEQFFFDGICLNDSTYCMVMANRGELSVWHCVNKTWKQGITQEMNVSGYFSLFQHKSKTYLMLSDGKTFEVSLQKLKPVNTKLKGNLLREGVLVENRDAKTIGFLKHNSMDQTKPFQEELNKKLMKLL